MPAISPPPGSSFRYPGGAPGNVAAGVARLGGRAALVSAVGDDPFGDSLLATLRGHGVETGAVRRVTDRTSLAFVAPSIDGIPDFLFYRGADATLRPGDIPDVLPGRASILYVTSMPFLDSPAREATLHAIDLARAAGTPIAADPNLRLSSWPDLATARRVIAPLLEADILKVSEDEARLLTGEEDVRRSLEALSAPPLVVITQGERGAIWRFRGETGSAPSPRVEVIETTGAGDAFMAALLFCIARRAGTDLSRLSLGDVADAVRIACTAGALACTRLGAMPALPTWQEVEASLQGGGASAWDR
ncbi:MAG TPA: carbohydrate kinase [Chloroflexota bacterium]|nr:carbohydrate kinase [Chloroflexota bacterium]